MCIVQSTQRSAHYIYWGGKSAPTPGGRRCACVLWVISTPPDVLTFRCCLLDPLPAIRGGVATCAVVSSQCLHRRHSGDRKQGPSLVWQHNRLTQCEDACLSELKFTQPYRPSHVPLSPRRRSLSSPSPRKNSMGSSRQGEETRKQPDRWVEGSAEIRYQVHTFLVEDIPWDPVPTCQRMTAVNVLAQCWDTVLCCSPRLPGFDDSRLWHYLQVKLKTSQRTYPITSLAFLPRADHNQRI